MASVPIVVRYELDPTGQSPANAVTLEEHTLGTRAIRAIVPTYGAYFTASLSVLDVGNNRTLTKGVDYETAQLYELPSARYGAEICAIILVTNSNVSQNVAISYQALGGEYSTSFPAIVQMYENIIAADRPVTWPSIIGKPNAFNPASHYESIADSYGWEYVVQALDRIHDAILLGDQPQFEAVYAYIDAWGESLENSIENNPVLLNHIANQSNPHNVTATQVGLGNVPNYPAATTPQAQAGTSDATLMTPLKTFQAIDSRGAVLISDAIDFHSQNPDAHGSFYLATTAQTLTATQQTQARVNIGFSTGINDLVPPLITTAMDNHLNAEKPHGDKYVSGMFAQSFTGTQAAQARNNIDVYSRAETAQVATTQADNQITNRIGGSGSAGQFLQKGSGNTFGWQTINLSTDTRAQVLRVFNNWNSGWAPLTVDTGWWPWSLNGATVYQLNNSEGAGMWMIQTRIEVGIVGSTEGGSAPLTSLVMGRNGSEVARQRIGAAWYDYRTQMQIQYVGWFAPGENFQFWLEGTSLGIGGAPNSIVMTRLTAF